MKVLITGATGGFGRILADFLLRQGLQVVGTSRHPDRHECSFPLYPLDVSDDTFVAEGIQYILSREERIDVLVNCVNELVIASTEEHRVADLCALYQTNVFGVMRVSKAILPAFRRQQSGLIINMSSLGGLLAVPYFGAYTSAKFALEALTEALYHELRDEPIDVVIMQPVAMYMERPATGSHLRVADGVAADSFSHNVVNMMARDTASSKLKPERVAAKIHQIIRMKKRPLRVPMDRARAITLVKRIAPQRIINGLIDNLMKNAGAP